MTMFFAKFSFADVTHVIGFVTVSLIATINVIAGLNAFRTTIIGSQHVRLFIGSITWCNIHYDNNLSKCSDPAILCAPVPSCQ